MPFKSHQSRVRLLRSGEPGFNIVDGITVNPRAGFEISLYCPREYRLIIQDCVDKGWLKPVACVVDYEQTMDELKGVNL